MNDGAKRLSELRPTGACRSTEVDRRGERPYLRIWPGETDGIGGDEPSTTLAVDECRSRSEVTCDAAVHRGLSRNPGVMPLRKSSDADPVSIPAPERATYWTADVQTSDAVDIAVRELHAARQRCGFLTAAELLAAARACIPRIGEVAREWVALAATAKGLAVNDNAAVEDVLTGPVLVLRQLRLLAESLSALAEDEPPQLPGSIFTDAAGRTCVPVMPVRGLFDPLTFVGFRGWARLLAGVSAEDAQQQRGRQFRDAVTQPPKICTVLGAGNVSAIPATDTLAKVFQERRRVLLKLNPVNDYLGPIFRHVFEPLIRAGVLRIVSGGAEIGRAAVEHDLVDEVHITGSNAAYEAIVWGDSEAERQRRKRDDTPKLTKPITSELGNVSPWLIVPGRYSRFELQFQAENVAASLTNNAGFNCAATRVIVTDRRWPQREDFLTRLRRALERTPQRRAYYPGAVERFRRFAPPGTPEPASDVLPWTLTTNVSPDANLPMFRRESFTCLSVEVPLDAGGDPQQFVVRAAEFCNEKLWGTLSASITLPWSVRRSHAGRRALNRAVDALQYGTIAVNHWPGVAYAVGSLPWGGYPIGTLAEPFSGQGFVHNPFFVDGIEKSVFVGPSVLLPKPVWFASHRRPQAVAWKLFDLYCRPTWSRAANIAAAAIRFGLF